MNDFLDRLAVRRDRDELDRPLRDYKEWLDDHYAASSFHLWVPAGPIDESVRSFLGLVTAQLLQTGWVLGAPADPVPPTQSIGNMSRSEDLLIVPPSQTTAAQRLAWKQYGSQAKFVTTTYSDVDNEGFDRKQPFCVLTDGRVTRGALGYNKDFDSDVVIEQLIDSLAEFAFQNQL